MQFKSALPVAIFCATICSILPASEAVAGQLPGKVNLNRQYALGSRCSSAEKERIAQCEPDAIRDWDIRDVDYVSILLTFDLLRY